MVEKVYEPAKVGKLLGLTTRTVGNYLRAGTIKGIKVGREWRVTDSDLTAYIEGLKSTRGEGSRSKPQARVIFDNGGGTTLQLTCGKLKYAHTYAAAGAAAVDYCAFMGGESLRNFEGHDPESMFEPDPEIIRNGGFRIWREDGDPSSSWINERTFTEVVRKGGQ